MQMLCRLFFAGAALAALLAGVPLAQAQPAPRELMLQQAQQWVAAGLGRPAAQVQFAPLDERVQVRPCGQALVFDWPFPSRETLRVRCPQAAGGWQIYLRISEGAASVRAPAADTPTMGATRKVVVARRALGRGTLLQPDMLALAEVPVGPALQAPLDQLVLAQHAELRRDVPAGAPIQAHELRRVVLVKQGQMAVLSIGQGQGFEIAVRVEVLQDGRMGEQVRLKNPDSGKPLTGIVTGPNALRGL